MCFIPLSSRELWLTVPLKFSTRERGVAFIGEEHTHKQITAVGGTQPVPRIPSSPSSLLHSAVAGAPQGGVSGRA